MTQKSTSEGYRHLSERKALPVSCPIAAIDKCPRYFVSLQHATSAGVLDAAVGQGDLEALTQKWSTSDTFVVADGAVSSTCGRKGTLTGVGGFCPELAARIFGDYCSDLASFPDDDARSRYNAQLDKKMAKADDPRRVWMVYSPKHYSECSEFNIYAEPGLPSRTKAKPRRKGITPSVRFKVLARDSYRCVYCGVTGETSALHVDHKKSLAEGGTDDPTNLVTACERCNLGKGAISAK